MTRHLFGPVPSRRFGWSLGVDLLTPKVCTYDCIFCEVGRTTRRTTERREYVPLVELESELTAWLLGGGTADFITLAGSGEPTLHSRFGELLDFLGGMSRIRRALLTNGSLLHVPEVREAASKADVVKVSYSAATPEQFQRLNRPDDGVAFERLREGLLAFRRQFPGELWMEVFLVPGLNDDRTSVEKLARDLAEVRPERIHLNTTARPPAVRGTGAVEGGRLAALAALFRPLAEIIPDFGGAPCQAGTAEAEDRILAYAARRPCTSAELSRTLGISESEARAALDDLVGQGRLRRERQGDAEYYRAV